jgi:hypothetical protein
MHTGSCYDPVHRSQRIHLRHCIALLQTDALQIAYLFPYVMTHANTPMFWTMNLFLSILVAGFVYEWWVLTAAACGTQHTCTECTDV